MLQLCANNPDTVHHPLRDIVKHTRDGMALRYRMNGFVSPPRPSGAPRNLFGFADGVANPTENDQLIWVRPGTGEGGRRLVQRGPPHPDAGRVTGMRLRIW